MPQFAQAHKLSFVALAMAFAMNATPMHVDIAHAQTRPIGDQPFSSSAKRLKGRGAEAFGAAVGYNIAPGVILTPSAFSESGSDSNPDQSFDPALGGAINRIGTGVSLTKIGKDGAANISAKGSWLDIYEDDVRGDRLSGTISADGVYSLAPGLSLSAGGFYAHNGDQSVEDNTAAGFAELTYINETVTGFVRGRIIDVDFLTNSAPPPGTPAAQIGLFDIENFNAQRREVSVGLLYGNNAKVAPYFEAAAAEVDYTDQTAENIIDRDANDFYVKGGLRFTFSPFLQADVGGRWNRRDLDNDPLVDSFTAGYFDGSINWAPSQYFSAFATVDRTIEEPSLLIGRLSDVKGFEFGFFYAPTDKIDITSKFRREILDEIGTVNIFRRRLFLTELTYDVSPYYQLYSNFLYEKLEEDATDSEYDRFKFVVGSRVYLGESATRSNFFGDGFRVPNEINLPSGAILRTSVGYSYLDLASTEMTTILGGAFFDEVIGRVEDHDGNLDGVRTDIELEKFARHHLRSGHSLTFGAAAFYAYFEDTQTSECVFTARIDCAYVNIVDFDRTQENYTGPTGDLFSTTDRRVHYWGISLDAKLGRQYGGGLKDDPVHRELPFKFGVALKAINQETDVFAIERQVPDPIDYKEDLNTYYYGGYVGLDHVFRLNHGFRLRVDAEAGYYYAHSDYEGRYLAFVPVGGTNFIIEQGALDLADDKGAFIGDIRVDLLRDFSWGSLGIYGQAEYLSHVAFVRYNDNDDAGGSPFGTIGQQVGTVLDSTDAFSYTVGVTATVPFQ